MVDYKRTVNHTGYRNKKKWKKHFAKVHKEITKQTKGIPEEQTAFECVTDHYWVFKTFPNIIVYIGGGACLIMIIGFFLANDEMAIGHYILFSLMCILFLFFVIYFFTKPKKEHILNRLDGLITFTGWYWHPNVTMTFEDVEFIFSTGGDDGSNSFQLEVIRPDRLNSRESFSTGELNCYDDMSLIAWYMDKNRPLPPGTAFDPYRQKDFERRKAEGFPPPLYESNIKTPEATKEQQAERDNYWRG